MKFFKKCPLFILLIITGLLFTIVGILGRRNVYAGQEYDPVKMPVLAVMFTALNDEIYPWQVFTEESIQTLAPEKGKEDAAGYISENESDSMAETEENVSDEQTDTAALDSEAPEGENALSEDGAAGAAAEASPVPSPDGTVSAETKEPETEAALERLLPLRESTYEEYINHISADIYGDAGVKRAAEYEFATVDESYFDDALFIGDSRTVGLRDYTDLTEHADFYCETSLTIYKVLGEDFGSKGTVEDALANKDYGKIYLMVGINELGRGTTEDFMEEYTKVVDRLHELEPEAKIFIQGNMRVSGKKDSSDAIFNNSNINARNNAIATLADNKQIFYIDVNEVVCDEDGNLNAEYTFDQIHVLGVYNDLWKQFLLEHGAKD